MALSYKARRRWSLLILVIGLPVYAVLAVNLVALLPVLPKFLEFILYVVLGTAWAFPLKFVFKGIGQVDPDADDNTSVPLRAPASGNVQSSPNGARLVP